MEKFLLYQQNKAIVTLTMNQPEVRNALTGNTAVEEFVQACARISSDPSVRVVILTGAGPTFSSGGNVKAMKRYFAEDVNPEKIREEYRHGIQRLPLALYNLEVPTIAAVNGPAIGAGCDLVSRVVPHEKLLEEANVLAVRIAANPGSTLRMTKRLLREGQHMRLESLLELSASFQALAHKTKQHAEAVNAFLEKRPPNFSDD
jgi:enoyl-CoA hydratase/carnithine racemase